MATYLIDLGIVKNQNKTTDIFQDLYPSFSDFPNVSSPSQFITSCWNSFELSKHNERDLRGNFFECLLAVLFVKKGLVPFTMQANLQLIPNVNYDFLFFTENTRKPIVVSAKTSLRERYKQAELEAQVLKNVFQQANSFLISLNSSEVVSRKKDLMSGNLTFLSDVIDARNDEFDEFVLSMQKHKFVETTNIQIMKEGTKFINLP